MLRYDRLVWNGRSDVHPAEADYLQFDDANQAELAAHDVSPTDASQVFWNSPIYMPNRRSVTGEWLMIGPTDGGRFLTISVVCDEITWLTRPITGWDSDPSQVARWRKQRGR